MRLIIIVASLMLMTACSSGKDTHEEESSELSHREEIRLKQYIVQGKRLYLTHCANCHQADGSGLAKLYPPLAKSDYLMADLKRAACIIKNGMNQEIVVNGITFNQPMPANDELDPIDVAEIVTYISNSWGNQANISSTRDVSIWLKKCE